MKRGIYSIIFLFLFSNTGNTTQHDELDEISGWGFTTIQECISYEGTTPLHFDSDGDGIADILEDPDGDCACGAEEFSCWYRPDSDGDGILDSFELNGGTINPSRNPDQPFCGTSPHYDPCDVDGDGVSNAQDTDSDGDVRKDWEEDSTYAPAHHRHTSCYDRSAPAYFYRMSATGVGPLYLDNRSQKVRCDSLLHDSPPVLNDSFIINRDLSGMPVRHDWQQYPNLRTQVLILLTCRRDGFEGGRNFNGRRDQPTETNLYIFDFDNFFRDMDSDGDGLSDAIENRLGTDPCHGDTDGDGLNDGLEVLRGVAKGCGSSEIVFTNPMMADTDADGVSDFDEVHRLHTDPTRRDSDSDGPGDRTDPCPCDPSPTCEPPPQPTCTNGDAGDAPAVGSVTEIRRGSEILLSKKDSCYPSGRARPDVLKEYYCDPQSGQIMLHWYICKPSACTTNAQGLGSCPDRDARLITNPAAIPLP